MFAGAVSINSERSERASISRVQWKLAIYIYLYVCMYSFFYGTFTRACMNNLDEQHISLTNATGCSITNSPWKKRKQIKEKAGMGERSQTE